MSFELLSESNQCEESLSESSKFMVTRLLRFWEGRNVKKGGGFIGVHMVLLDDKQLQNDHPQQHSRVHLKLHYIQLHVHVKFFLLFKADTVKGAKMYKVIKETTNHRRVKFKDFECGLVVLCRIVLYQLKFSCLAELLWV
ncbi:hypothetical protein Bca101_082870 [Brassica carinata]